MAAPFRSVYISSAPRVILIVGSLAFVGGLFRCGFLRSPPLALSLNSGPLNGAELASLLCADLGVVASTTPV